MADKTPERTAKANQALLALSFLKMLCDNSGITVDQSMQNKMEGDVFNAK
jgi:hypothetical protein